MNFSQGRRYTMKKQHWQDWVNLLLGIGVVLSPWVIGNDLDGAVRSSYSIVGIAVALFAIYALIAFRPWEEWANLVFGTWLFVSPWVLGFSAVTALTWSAVFIGALIVVCAGWALTEEQSGRPVSK
jgi:hypothetical protein